MKVKTKRRHTHMKTRSDNCAENLNKTIAAQMNALIVGLTSLAEKIGTVTFGPLIENLIGIATKFADFLDKSRRRSGPLLIFRANF